MRPLVPAIVTLLLCGRLSAQDDGRIKFDGDRSRPDISAQAPAVWRPGDLRDAASVARLACDKGVLHQALWTLSYAARKGNVDAWADAFERRLAECRVKPETFGMRAGYFAEQVEQGRRVELSRVTEKARAAAPFRNVDDLTAEMNVLARRLKFVPAEVAPEALALREKGRRARALCERSATEPRPKLPAVRNQGQVGWCYAFASADALSARFARPVSAVDVALTYNERNISGWTREGSTKIEGGWPDKAMEDVLERGICWESSVPSANPATSNEGMTLVSLGPGRVEEAVALQIDLYRKLEAIPDKLDAAASSYAALLSARERFSLHADDNGAACTPAYRASNDYARAINRACMENYALARRLFPNLTPDEFFEKIQLAERPTILKDLAQASCRRTPVSGLKVGGGVISPDEKGFAVVMAQLRKGDPVVVTYDANILGDFESTGDSKWHASLLVDSRWNDVKQSCELLLRNSWGRTCRYYDKYYECQDGNIWIPAEIMLKASYRADYIE